MMSRFPSCMINAWSSGTGMAGLLGSSIYILFGCTVGNDSDKTNKLHHLTKYAFLLTTPAVLLYWLAYFLVLRFETNHADDTEANIQAEHVKPSVHDDAEPLLSNTHPTDTAAATSAEDDDVAENSDCRKETEPSWHRIKRCTSLVLYMAFNLCAVYVFEYVARGCAAKVRPQSEYHVGCPELYAALQLCYQAGVFVSRSSVQLVQIRRVSVMTVLQLFNMVLWVVDVRFKVVPVYLLPALMVYVGLLGGASYVNIFYMLLHDDKYPARDRELCINITAMFITLGIVLGTGVETALFTTLLKND